MRQVLEGLLQTTKKVEPTRGPNTELTGVVLELRNPLARISRSEGRGRIFSALGELFWYLGGSNCLKRITYYIKNYEKESEDGRTVSGAYGPRIFGSGDDNQVENVLDLLRESPATRKAVIQLFSAGDLRAGSKSVPCTCTIQLLLRDDRLHLIAHMRSNDAYLGLPHDIFVFTMLQEIFARSLGVEMGIYKHLVGSLHLYEDHREAAREYLEEGYHSTMAPMPMMPAGDPWMNIRDVLDGEARIREKGIQGAYSGLPDYWADILRLLEVFKMHKVNDKDGIRDLRGKMVSRVFDAFILRRCSKGNGGTSSSIPMEKANDE